MTIPEKRIIILNEDSYEWYNAQAKIKNMSISEFIKDVPKHYEKLDNDMKAIYKGVEAIYTANEDRINSYHIIHKLMQVLKGQMSET